MKLFLLTQEKYTRYDTFDKVVVAAEHGTNAAQIHPFGNCKFDPISMQWIDTNGNTVWWCWPAPNYVKVEYLGEAKAGATRGVILASFRAG